MNSQAAHTEKHRVLWSSSKNADGINPGEFPLLSYTNLCNLKYDFYFIICCQCFSAHTYKTFIGLLILGRIPGELQTNLGQHVLLQSSFSKHDGPRASALARPCSASGPRPSLTKFSWSDLRPSFRRRRVGCWDRPIWVLRAVPRLFFVQTVTF